MYIIFHKKTDTSAFGKKIFNFKESFRVSLLLTLSTPGKLTSDLLLFDDNKIKTARKPGKKQKENPVVYNREGTR